MSRPNNKEKLEAFEKRYRELAKISFRSDQEDKELEQLEKEIEFLKDTIHDEESQQTNLNDLKELEKKENIALNKPKKQKKRKDFIDESLLDSTTKLELGETRKKHNLLNAKLKILNLEQDIERKQEKIKEMEKEKQYVTKKPDKDGYMELDQAKYEKKMAMLQDQLDKATGYFEKSRIQRQINELKMAKAQVKVNNAAVKIRKGSQKVQNFMNTLTKTFDELGKFSGFDNSRKKNDDDYGFSTDKVFKF